MTWKLFEWIASCTVVPARVTWCLWPDHFLESKLLLLVFDVMQISPCTLKMRVKGPQNRATCFATFLQNELNNDVACFTSHVQTCLATKEVVAGCEKFFQKVDGGSTFCKNIYACCAFYRSKALLFCNKWHPRLANMALFVIACFSLAPRFRSFSYTICSTLHPRSTLITHGFIVEAKNCEKWRIWAHYS